MKSLYLFTAKFPYEDIESFLEDELKYLSQAFDKIYIFPQDGDVCRKRPVPANCIVMDPLRPYKSKLLFVLRGVLGLRVIKVALKDFFGGKVYRSWAKMRAWLLSVMLLNNYLKHESIRKVMRDIQKGDVCYYYWGVGWNSLSVILKNIAPQVSRFHGEWDLWEESYNNYVPLRKEIMQSLDRALLISRKGEVYIHERYPASCTVFCPLGTEDYGWSPAAREPGLIKVISCSTVYPLKRVPLIFEVLNTMEEYRIEWTHIGGGQDFDKLASEVTLKRKNHLSVNLVGAVSHQEVISHYRNNKYDVFLNLSVNEGVPVSIMEVASFNIPVIATNVGATSEVVAPEVGRLVSANPSISEVQESIRTVINGAFSPRQYWENHYNAPHNYTALAELLKNL